MTRRPAIVAEAAPDVPPAAVAPILRGLTSGAGRLILDFRGGEAVRAFVDEGELERRASGPVTPDHVIRTKPRPLILPVPVADGLDRFADDAKAAIAAFVRDYETISSATTRVRRNPNAPWTLTLASSWSAGWAVRARQLGESRGGGRRLRGDHGACRSGGRVHRPVREHFRGGHLRHRILVARAGETRQDEREASLAPHRGGDRRRVRHRPGGGGGVRPGRCGGRDPRPRPRDGGERGRCHRRPRLFLRRHRSGFRHGGLRRRRRVLRRSRHPHLERGRGVGRERSARSTRRRSARASSSISTGTSGRLRRPCASCAPKVSAACCCSTRPSRR